MGIIAVILAFGILVIFHEFGHYIFALLTGMEVKKFSIGFGHPILKKRLGKTDFLLSIIPLGGYVKIKGDEFEEEGFYNFTLWKKIVVVLAGPLFSFLLAYILMVLTFSIYGKDVKDSIISVEESGYYYKEGFRTGDKLLRIEGDTVKDFSSMIRLFSKYNKEEVNITVKREGKIRDLQVNVRVDSLNEIGYFLSPVVGEIVKNDDVIKKGLSEGDIIKSIDGQDINSWYDVFSTINGNKTKVWLDPAYLDSIVVRQPGDSVFVEWQKPNGSIKSAYIRLIKLDNNRVGLGISINLNIKKMGILESLGEGFKWGWENTVLIFEFLIQLVRGRVSVKNLGGPVMIAKISFEAAKAGLKPYLIFIAFLSLNLMIVNLLPLPALDGGRALMFLIESIVRKRFSKKVWTWSVSISFLILILFLVFITFKDVMKLIGR